MGGATRPVLRYFGGKWRLAPWIIEHMPEHRIYTEVFGGAASVLLRKPRVYAEVLNDLDGEIVNVFRVLRDPSSAADLQRLVELTPFARQEFELSYEPTDDNIEQARRTLFRSFAGFGSGGASGHQTGFRGVSHGAGSTHTAAWRTFPAAIDAFTERLRGVVIECRPAADVLDANDYEDALHYVDPPYPFSVRGQGGHYRGVYRVEMGDDAEHRALAAVLRNLAGYVLLSGYECDLYDELYGDWVRVSRPARADGGRARTEALWLSPRTADALEAERHDLSGLPLFAEAAL